MDRYFKIKNFEKFQHYSGRRPAWIRFYLDLLSVDDRPYYMLSDVAKTHLHHLWLYQAKQWDDGFLPMALDLDDHNWIRQALNIRDELRIEELMEAGFVIECTSKGRELSEREPEILVEDGLQAGDKDDPQWEAWIGQRKAFDVAFDLYPNKVERNRAWLSFRSKIRKKHLKAFQEAFINYLKYREELGTRAPSPKHFKTFVNQYENYSNEAMADMRAGNQPTQGRVIPMGER